MSDTRPSGPGQSAVFAIPRSATTAGSADRDTDPTADHEHSSECTTPGSFIEKIGRSGTDAAVGRVREPNDRGVDGDGLLIQRPGRADRRPLRRGIMRRTAPAKRFWNINFAGAALHNPTLRIFGLMRCSA